MKHLLRNLWIAALIVCCNFQQVSAQQLPPIPIDQDVRIGKLDNGLTYYIRKNSLPANRADFYIAQKVGYLYPSNFIKMFRQTFECTPLQYRNNSKQNGYTNAVFKPGEKKAAIFCPQQKII